MEVDSLKYTADIDSLTNVIDSLKIVCAQNNTNDELIDVIQNGITVKTDLAVLISSIVLSLLTVGVTVYIAYIQQRIQKRLLQYDNIREYGDLYKCTVQLKKYVDFLPNLLLDTLMSFGENSTLNKLEYLESEIKEIENRLVENEVAFKLRLSKIEFYRFDALTRLCFSIKSVLFELKDFYRSIVNNSFESPDVAFDIISFAKKYSDDTIKLSKENHYSENFKNLNIIILKNFDYPTNKNLSYEEEFEKLRELFKMLEYKNLKYIHLIDGLEECKQMLLILEKYCKQ